MRKQRRKPNKSQPRRPDFVERAGPHSSKVSKCAGFIILTGFGCGTVAGNLHSAWAPYPWLLGIALWAYYFWAEQAGSSSASHDRRTFSYIHLLIVLIAAGVLRLYKLFDLPLGPNVDELFTLNNSLELLERPFDLFAHTPLIAAGWVETSNLYLYFNLAILKLFGVSYWSMKLFSVLPGILACGAMFLIGQLMFDSRIAFWTALLFLFGHWPVRLSRYGWDASFMVATFAASFWLLLLALQRGRLLFAYLSGVAAGISLYSYLSARICLLSLLLFWITELLVHRGRSLVRQCTAFVTGLAMVAFPLLCYYWDNSHAFWVRAAELSVFNSADPVAVLLDNLWRHLLMFFTVGGAYSRDNYPGLPMLDPVTGALLLAGLIVVSMRLKEYAIRLLLLTFALNLTPGIFSISQEGAPYVYRTAAVMIPVFVTIGYGLQWATTYLAARASSKAVNLSVWTGVLLINLLNLYLYFGLEAKNGAAMRIMAYEPRLLALEIARDEMPALLLREGLFESRPQPTPNERYPLLNPPLILPFELQKLAVITLSNRFDPARSLADNYENPRHIYFRDLAGVENESNRLTKPIKLIFRSGTTHAEEFIRKNYPGTALREIRNIYGAPLYSVATVSGGAVRTQ